MPTVDKNGIVREYRIIIFEVALGNSSAQVIIYKPGNRARRAITIDPYNQAITGLKKFTQYAIQIYGVTIGDGPVSPTLYVTTAEDGMCMHSIFIHEFYTTTIASYFPPSLPLSMYHLPLSTYHLTIIRRRRGE